MKYHPGGEEHTRNLISLAEGLGLTAGMKVLDMGAGGGEAVRILQQRGYSAPGVDLEPGSLLVEKGNMLQTGYPDGSFDAVLSQCAFFVSGRPEQAAHEAHRLLRSGGLLLLSDVFFPEPALPGFRILQSEDMTQEWREYYLEALWRGEDCGCEVPRGSCRYLMLIARKELENGSV